MMVGQTRDVGVNTVKMVSDGLDTEFEERNSTKYRLESQSTSSN